MFRKPIRVQYWAILALSLLLMGTLCKASDTTYDRESLRGLPGVSVVVEGLGDIGKQAGLTVEQLQTDVELKLRQAGIKVLSKSEVRSTPGAPHLYVNVYMLQSGACHIDVRVNQFARLERRNSTRVIASTWSIEALGFTPAIQAAATIRRNVGARVDRFISAYLAVNPRK